MFDSSDWIYIAASFGLGLGVRELMGRIRQSKSGKSSVIALKQEQQDLQQRLTQTQLAYHIAQETGAFKAGFLARTTHALRSPLNGLIGLHQLILSDLCENPEEEREFTEQALERALKLLKLIDEILNVARVQAGTNRLNLQPFSVTDIFKETHNLTAILAENRNYKYDLIFPAEDIHVFVDPYWLRYTLVSLVETAIAGMEEGGISMYIEPSNRSRNTVTIYLDVPQHALPTQEPIDLATTETLPTAKPGHTQTIMSPGMKMILNQNILEAMGGKLEIYAHPENNELTRLLVSLPRCQG